MIKKLWFAVLLIAVLGLTLLVTAQVPDKAVDPVCGMSVVKDGAKWTYDYNGTTYYFCSEGCKTSFSKEPDKYLAKTAEAKKMGGGMGMMGGMSGQGQGMMRGQMQGAAVPPGKAIDPVCGMTVTKDGAKWTYDYNGTTYYFCSEGCKTSFSKEPQKYLAKMDEAKPMGGGMGMMGGMGGQGQGQMQGGMGMMPEMQNMRGQLMRMRNEIDMMMQRMRMMAGRMQGGMGEMQGGMIGGMMGGMGGQGQGMMHEQMAAGMPGGMECPMMMEGVDRKIENTKSGIVVTLTSKDPEMVKKLQDHMAKMKNPKSGKLQEDAASGACPGCPSAKIK